MRKGSNDFNRQESISFNHYPLGKRSCGRGDRTFLTYHVIIRVIMALSVKASHPKWPLYQVGFFYIFTKWINFFLFCNVTSHDHMIKEKYALLNGGSYQK